MYGGIICFQHNYYNFCPHIESVYQFPHTTRGAPGHSRIMGSQYRTSFMLPIWHLKFGGCSRSLDSLLNLGFLTLCEFLATSKISVNLYLLYSPDLAVYDLFLFQKHMMSLKGRRFNESLILKNHGGYLPRSKNTIHRMLQKVVHSLVLLYQVGRKLLCKGNFD